MIREFVHGQSNPLDGLVEKEHDLFRYVQMFALRQLAEAIWKITPKEDRRNMLRHLYAHIRDDNHRPFHNFNVLHELVDEGFDEPQFVALADEEDYDGELPMVLHPYVALYVDVSGGVNRAKFSSDAFYSNYRRAHGIEA